ncbi:MAG TPA: hypothetical protein VMW48_02450 [Vicinamibacterales bacterium]|nr:hypothetical protein [Vicinamibacterales bacterium]
MATDVDIVDRYGPATAGHAVLYELLDAVRVALCPPPWMTQDAALADLADVVQRFDLDEYEEGA